MGKFEFRVTNDNTSGKTPIASSPLPSRWLPLIAVPSAAGSQITHCGNICSRLIPSGWKGMAEMCPPASRHVIHWGRKSQQGKPLAEQVPSAWSWIYPTFNLEMFFPPPFSSSPHLTTILKTRTETNRVSVFCLSSHSCTCTDKQNSPYCYMNNGLSQE